MIKNMSNIDNESTTLVIASENLDDIVALEKEYKFLSCKLSKSEG
jgi:hypothetical protein